MHVSATTDQSSTAFACANQSVAQEVRCTNSPEKPLGGKQQRSVADLPVTVSSSEAQQILI